MSLALKMSASIIPGSPVIQPTHRSRSNTGNAGGKTLLPGLPPVPYVPEETHHIKICTDASLGRRRRPHPPHPARSVQPPTASPRYSAGVLPSLELAFWRVCALAAGATVELGRSVLCASTSSVRAGVRRGPAPPPRAPAR